MSELYKAFYESEIGVVEIEGSEDGITYVEFTGVKEHDDVPGCLEEACKQIREYFEGKRKIFELKLAPKGTEFQRKVWGKLLEVPYGKTVTYTDIARAVDNPKGVRAVGSANGSNPISIIIPCHRIIGSNGSLTGYGGGLWRKKWLLEHEARNS